MKPTGLRTKAALYGCLLTLGLTGRASAEPVRYEVTTGDTLLITVYGDAGLTGTFPVSTEGTIGYPILGNVTVTGRTVGEISDEISDLLKEHIANLSVAVAVKEYAPVFILGDVQRPGKQEFRPGMIVLELFALGGGLKDRLATGDVTEAQLATLRQDYADMGLQVFAQTIRRARLQAELSDGAFQPDVDFSNIRDKAGAQGIIDSEQQMYAARLAAYTAELKSTELQKISYVEEIETLKKSSGLRNEELALLSEDVDAASKLMERGLSPKTAVREKQREISATNRDALEAGSFLARAQQNLSSIEGRLQTLKDTRRNDAAQGLREVELDLLRLKRKMEFDQQSLAEMGVTLQNSGASVDSMLRFSAVRLVDGVYQETPIEQHDRVLAGDIVRVRLSLDETNTASVQN